MTETSPDPHSAADRFIDLIVALQARMFLSAVGGDVSIARAIAMEALGAYRVQTSADLLCAAQVTGFGIAALASLSQSMADTLSASMALRLRANAVAANRAGENCRRALAPPPSQAPVREPDAFANTQANSSAAHQARKHAAEAAARPRAAPPPQAEPAAEVQRRSMWAAAMTDVAAEVTADLANLPAPQRREASMRAAALSSVAQDLLAGKDGQFPSSFQPRPNSQSG